MPDQRHDRGPSYGALTCRCGRPFASKRALAAHVGHYAPRGTHHGRPQPKPRLYYVHEIDQRLTLQAALSFYEATYGGDWVREFLRGGTEMAAPNGAQGALI